MLEEESTADDAAELCSLAEAVCNGTVTTAQYERLNAPLSANEDAARFYATYLRMHGLLLWHWRDADVSPVCSPALPIVVETSPLSTVSTSLFANVFSPGSYMFSYSLALFIVGVGLLIGWACQVPRNQEVAATGQRPAHNQFQLQNKNQSLWVVSPAWPIAAGPIARREPSVTLTSPWAASTPWRRV